MDKNRRVRQIDIARRAKVHQSTVSFVLGGEEQSANKGGTVRVPPKTVELIRKIAAEMGYTPNRSALELRGQRSRVIGMLMQPPRQKYYSERFARLVNIEQIAYQRGYRVVIGHLLDPGKQIDDYVDDFVSRNIEGVLCLAHELGDNPNLIAERLSVLPNVVYFNKPRGGTGAHYVCSDYSDGIQQAISHLAAKGRQRIGIALMGKRYYPMVERFKGYQKGLKNAGISFDEKKVWFAPETSVLTDEFKQQIIKKLVIEAKADAILAADDEWGCLLISELLSRGIKVPDDIAVIGYDNMSISQFVSPKLTTVDSDYEVVGEKMINMLLDLIEKRDSRQAHHIIKPHLVVRESA